MAVTLKGQSAIYEGTSADMKPSDADKNAIFQELDTGIDYYYDGTDWNEIPSSGGGGGGTGTDNYNDLNNKPSINGTTLSGNKSLDNLGIQAKLTFDSAPTEDSENPVTSGGVYTALATNIQGIKVNGSTVNPDSNKVVNITVPTSAADVSALPDTTKYAAALKLTINSSTFVMTGQLKDQNGNNLGTAQTIDLPLESVVVGGSYNSQTKKVVLTLQNGNTIEFSVADLVYGLQTELSETNKLNPAYINYDSTHRAVSDAEKSEWNGKQDAIDSSHKLSADFIDDTGATNKFATEEELEQIETNKNNISTVSDANGTKNLLDFNDWASKVNTTRATKSISGNSITLTATGNDAYTDGVVATCPASGKIACEPNTTYVITWETTSTSISDNVYIFPANASPYYRAAFAKYIEYTMPAGCKYFTFRFGVANSGDTVTYSNIMICEKSLYDISNQYKPYAMSNAELTAKEQQNKSNILYNCINGGANLCPINSGTTTGAAFVFDWTNTGIIPAGVYEFSFETSTTTGAVACETQDSDGTRTGYRIITLPAKTGDITISDGTAKIRVFANAAMSLSKIRLVPLTFKDIPYQPYAMSNAELTAAIQALQAQLANQ